jgi:hypothetical protein
MFQLQAINTGGIGFFNIKIGVIVVEDISYPDTKRLGIAKGAIVHSIDIEVLKNTVAAIRQ